MSGDDPACKIRGLNGTDTNPNEFMNVDTMWFSYIFSLSVTMLSIFLTWGGGVAFVTIIIGNTKRLANIASISLSPYNPKIEQIEMLFLNLDVYLLPNVQYQFLNTIN